ncbi:MAG: 30S ribosomal protein S1 [Bacteroidota bacterium]|nr:30S ribosomal protein S1 [Bacteroidota bacterium]
MIEENKSEADKKVKALKKSVSKKTSSNGNNDDEFLKNFNWHQYQEGIDKIDEKQIKEFENLVQANFVDTSDDNIIQGEVIHLTERDVIIDINAKSEGVISRNEFRYNPDLKVGDKVEVIVDIREDKTGQLILSHKKARTIKAWDKVNEAHDKSEIVQGYVKCRTKGGMIVDVFGIEAFLPGSQIDIKPIRDYDQYTNKNMDFKVVKINHEFKNVVVSHKALIEADLEKQKKGIIGQLEKGQVLEGSVKNMTSYGVFVDLGGVDGLIHITDLSWTRINHPSEVLDLDQTIKVVILDFDDDKSKIQLGLKQLTDHPWEKLGDEIQEGSKVSGKVVVIADYGAFVEIMDGIEGLVHVSEMSWSTHLRSAQDFVNVGDSIEAVVLTLDRDSRKMSLGIKQLTQDPWTDITKKFPVGSKHKGKVRNFTNFGVFIELEEGIDGLIYISDLSWSKKIKHPSEFLSIGDMIEVIVLDLDLEGRKLSLGHKQTKDNPWDIYEKDFAVDTIHSSKIAEVVEKGAIINFNDDLSAFVPYRHLDKPDGSKLVKDESADFVIIEFNREFKRVLASHLLTHNNSIKTDEEKEEVKKPKATKATKKEEKEEVKKPKATKATKSKKKDK